MFFKTSKRDRRAKKFLPWHIALTEPLVDEIRNTVGVDITTIAGWDRLAEDLKDRNSKGLLIDCLYVCCRSQCDRREMSPEEFAAALHPEKALLPGLLDALHVEILKLMAWREANGR